MASRPQGTPPDPTARLLGHSPAIQALRAQIRHLAAFDTLGNPPVPTLLLQGETGTGLTARVEENRFHSQDSTLRAEKIRGLCP